MKRIQDNRRKNIDKPLVSSIIHGSKLSIYQDGDIFTFKYKDKNKYVARKFEHITLEMLSKDYQTEETVKFKEVYDEFRRLQS